jgi:enoyl-CoA hydratase/carnithine racemase
MISLTVDGGVATITMAQPPVNAIDDAFLAAFGRCLDELERQSDAAVVMIRSDQLCFSAGADLAQIRGYFADEDGPRRMVHYVSRFHALFHRLEQLPAVTLAVINGPALGGGLELALSCDLRIAARSAKLGLPEARVGMIPGAGGTQRLTRLCGIGTASRLILTAEVVDGEEAERLGLVQWHVADAQLAQHAYDLTERVRALSKPALQAAKDCLAAYFDPDVDGYRRELEKPLVLMKTVEARQRIERFLSAGRTNTAPSTIGGIHHEI